MSGEISAGEARTDQDASTDEKSDDPIQAGGPLANLTAFQRDLLWVLAKRGGSMGLAIKQNLEGYYSEHVNHGRLYPNLDELVDAGLVEKGKRDDRTNEYTLTDAGFSALVCRREWTEAEATA
jgi:DNA-binding PadR family transcriptional regulator